jgi:hypothetical protein
MGQCINLISYMHICTYLSIYKENHFPEYKITQYSLSYLNKLKH